MRIHTGKWSNRSSEPLLLLLLLLQATQKRPLTSSSAVPERQHVTLWNKNVASGRMNHWRDLTHCFLSVASFPSFLLLGHLQHQTSSYYGKDPLRQRKSHSSSPFSPCQSTLQGRGESALRTPSALYSYSNVWIPADDFRHWEGGAGRFPSSCFDVECDSGRIPHLFLPGWLNLFINLSEWAVESDGRRLFLLSIYQICPLVPSS